MSVSVIAKFVAIVSLWAAYLVTTPAAAQRAVGGYADHDFQNQALAAGGYRQRRFEAYPQQRSSENYGGDSLEFLISGGQSSPDGYSASYPQSGNMGYDDASYRQAAYGSAGAFDPPVQRGLNPIYLRQEVEYDGRQPPNTIVIDTQNKFLYLVQPVAARSATGSALAVPASCGRASSRSRARRNGRPGRHRLKC